jgi:hypothetical protein
VEEEKEEEKEKEKTMNSCIFWDITYCRASCLLHAGFLLGVFFGREVEAKCSSETSVDFQRTTWRYIPEENFS